LGQFVAAAAALVALAGCAIEEASRPSSITPATSSLSDELARQHYRQSPSPGLSCVPYARDRTGVALRGDAYAWWQNAAGSYQRSQRPEPGAILVLRRTDRLRSGHVAVVSRIVSAREILVDHANWIPGQTITGMPVIDISDKNDWTLLRFWYAPARTFGSPYPAEGFIYPVVAQRDTPPVTQSDPIAGLILDQQ
jgi:surface antigen